MITGAVLSIVTVLVAVFPALSVATTVYTPSAVNFFSKYFPSCSYSVPFIVTVSKLVSLTYTISVLLL